MTAYLLCASPRSGSTLLCNLLKQAGAGKPHSYFRLGSIASWADQWGLPPTTPDTYGADYIAAAIKEGQNGTDTFALRSMWDSIDPLLSRLADLNGPAGDMTLLTDQFGPMHFIHLTRADMIAQAVSLAIAEQSGLWHRNADGSVLEQVKEISTPVYDTAAITKELSGLQADAIAWQHWFDANDIAPHRLTYEALSADPQHTLAKVLTHIGMDPAIAATIQPGTAKLANAVNRDWCARYRAEHGLPPAEHQA